MAVFVMHAAALWRSSRGSVGRDDDRRIIPTMPSTRAIVFAALGLLVTGCKLDPPFSAGFFPTVIDCRELNLRGQVTDDAALLVPGAPGPGAPSAPIAGAQVSILVGPGSGRSSVTGPDGAFVILNIQLPGNASILLEATHDAFEPQTEELFISGHSGDRVDGGCDRFPTMYLGQAPHSVTGYVRRIGSSAPIGGARVDVLDGENAGVSVIADSAGTYRIDNLRTSSPFRLRISADGYRTLVPMTRGPLKRNEEWGYTLEPQ